MATPSTAVQISEAPEKKGFHPGSWILYWLVIKPISLLPHFLIYGVADFFFIVLWYVAPYRRKVVLANLLRVFPDKSEAERKLICRKFYRHFADLVVESLKNFSISEGQANKRMRTLNPDLINSFADRNQSIVLCGGHLGNWELWGVAAPLQVRMPMLAIYKPLKNIFFDQKMRSSRGRFGLRLIATKQTGEYLRSHSDELNALVFGFDQSPADPNKCMWIDFFGIDTAAYFGPEKYAVDFNRPVIYGTVRKVRRGYYETTYEIVTENPRELEKGVITKRLFELLERDIRQQPEHWLWSHKRWKHRRRQVD